MFYAAPAALVWPTHSADSGDEEEEGDEDEDDAQTVILKSSPFSSPGTQNRIIFSKKNLSKTYRLHIAVFKFFLLVLLIK